MQDSPITHRHAGFYLLLKCTCAVPGSKGLLRRCVRKTIHSAPLSLKNKQRLYNFFAEATSPPRKIQCSDRVFDDSWIKLELNLEDDLSRQWYFWGYNGYESALSRFAWRLFSERHYRITGEVGANIGYLTC